MVGKDAGLCNAPEVADERDCRCARDQADELNGRSRCARVRIDADARMCRGRGAIRSIAYFRVIVIASTLVNAPASPCGGAQTFGRAYVDTGNAQGDGPQLDGQCSLDCLFRRDQSGEQIMRTDKVLMVVSCVLAGCMGVEETNEVTEESGEELIAEEGGGQSLCSSDCQCPLGTRCESGYCNTQVLAGPLPPNGPCFADCQCDAGQFCLGHSCTKPSITYTSGSGNSCGGNAGVAHPSPDALMRMTIVGKPGATVAKYNRHYSCGPAAQWWRDTGLDGYTIPSSGTLTINYPTYSPFACDNKILGGWQSYVVVGGLVSNVASFTYYDSPCGGSLSTCSYASSYCPPSGPCNGLGCP